MNLPEPYTGAVYDQMLSEAVEVVTSKLLQAYPTITAGKLSDLQDAVKEVLTTTLDYVAFKGFPGYDFTPGADNSHLVNQVASDVGLDPTETETIISEIYTEDAVGDTIHWFGNVSAQAPATETAALQKYAALQPSFWQRVAGTIVAPLGVSGATAITYAKIAVGLAALGVGAYVVRTVLPRR